MRDVIAAPGTGLDLRQHYGHHQSPAVRAGGLIFCSGMLPVDPHTGERRHGTLTSEAHVVLGNLKLLLESAGSSLDRLVPDRPLRIQHRSGRMWLLNSAALSELLDRGRPS